MNAGRGVSLSASVSMSKNVHVRVSVNMECRCECRFEAMCTWESECEGLAQIRAQTLPMCVRKGKVRLNMSAMKGLAPAWIG